MSSTKKIVFICSRLDLPGGIEKAITTTANLLASKGNENILLVLDETAKSFYPLSSTIKVIQLPLLFGIAEKGNIVSRKIAFVQDVFRLRKYIKELQPTHIIATEYQFLVAAILSGAKKIAKVYSWEHHEYSWFQKNFFWNSLLKYAYPQLDAVICLNETEAAHYKKFSKTIVIPNFTENSSGKKSSLDAKTILSVCWLIPRKGIDHIMTAAKIVFSKHPDWQWKIIGDGEMKEELIAFIQKEKLGNNLILQSPSGPYLADEYANTSIFVLASRLEPFGLVLIEAMSFGVPCISFVGPSGPAHIITNNEDGILVEKENPEKLAEEIIKLIEDVALRKKMGEKAFTNVQRFAPDKVYKEWQQLLTIHY